MIHNTRSKENTGSYFTTYKVNFMYKMFPSFPLLGRMEVFPSGIFLGDSVYPGSVDLQLECAPESPETQASGPTPGVPGSVGLGWGLRGCQPPHAAMLSVQGPAFETLL